MKTAKPTIVLVFEEEKDSAGLVGVLASADVSVVAHFKTPNLNSELTVKRDGLRIASLLDHKKKMLEELLTVLADSVDKTPTGDIVVPRGKLSELFGAIDPVQEEEKEEVAQVDLLYSLGGFDAELGEIKEEDDKAASLADSEQEEVIDESGNGDESAFFHDGVFLPIEAA